MPFEIFSTRAGFFLASLWWTQKVIQELGSSPLASVCVDSLAYLVPSANMHGFQLFSVCLCFVSYTSVGICRVLSLFGVSPL
jgi:hypothetical protein